MIKAGEVSRATSAESGSAEDEVAAFFLAVQETNGGSECCADEHAAHAGKTRVPSPPTMYKVIRSPDAESSPATDQRTHTGPLASSARATQVQPLNHVAMRSARVRTGSNRELGWR
jgi:hypothetical protein